VEQESAFSAKGVRLAVVGSGAPHYAKAFRESVGGSVPIYTDPELHTFKALSFKRGLGGIFSGSMWKRGVVAFSKGYRQGAVQGDATQLGGVLGLTAGGEIFYKYQSEFAGDHPSLDDLLEGIP
jgi:hypothetical protein